MAKEIQGRNGGTLIVPEKGDPSLNPAGRKPKTLRLVNDELKKEGHEPVTKGQVEEAYLLVVNLSEDELKRAVANPKNPMIIRIVGKELLKGKGFDVLERVLDRAHGKARQTIGGEGDLPIPISVEVKFTNGNPIPAEIKLNLPTETL